MDQEQNQHQDIAPTPSNAQPLPVPPTKKTHKKLALFLMIGPTALFLITILLYAVMNLVTSAAQPNTNTTDLFATTDPLVAAANVVLFILLTASILTWLPGIIIGIILLNKK